MNVGYIGLSAVGSDLARRLVAGGLPVTIWDGDAQAVATLRDSGGHAAASADELVRRCDVIFLYLRESADVEAVLFGTGGSPAAAVRGKIFIDQSDGMPTVTAKTAQRLAQLGATLLDAPILRMPPVLVESTLTVMLSGPADACETVLPVVHAISPNVVRCGERAGDAQAVTLINRTMTVAAGLNTLEAVAAGRKMGLGLQSITDILNKGSGRNYMTRDVLPGVLAGKIAFDVALSELLLALNRAIALSVACGAPTPIASVARGMLQAAVNRLGEHAPFQNVIQFVEAAADTTLLDLGDGSAAVGGTSRVFEQGTMTIGYVGVGMMGGAIARRLMLNYKVQVYDTRREITEAFAAEGAVVATDLKSLAQECDVVMLCLPTGAIVREVLFGTGGLAEGLSPGKICVDQTTGDPIDTQHIAAELKKFGIALVDAPVSGGPETAQAGTATIMCSGPRDSYETVLPILQTVGPNTFYCGQSGSGHAVKLVNNASNICNRMIAYEAAALGYKYGLSLAVLDDVVNKSTGWSFASTRMFKAVATHAQTAAISLDLSLKDIWSAVQMGMGCGAPMTISDTVRSLFQAAVNRFGGDANVDAIAGLFEELANIDFTKPQ